VRLRSSKARVWDWVGLARIVVGYASTKWTLLRVRLARSCWRVRKLWTGWPFSVRFRRAFRRAAGETFALATGDERCAAAAAGSSSLNTDKMTKLGATASTTTMLCAERDVIGVCGA
jgi:hypothetical protein